ncbi:META domain-containing protein, partial [Victivallis vadensis]
RYFGTAVVDKAEEDLKFPPLGTTRMAGPGMNYQT